MEIPLHTQYNGFALRDTLPHVCPLPCKLYRRLHSLRTGIHGENHVIPKHLRDLLCKAAEDRVVEGPRGEGQPLGLVNESGDNFWVTMAL